MTTVMQDQESKIDDDDGHDVRNGPVRVTPKSRLQPHAHAHAHAHSHARTHAHTHARTHAQTHTHTHTHTALLEVFHKEKCSASSYRSKGQMYSQALLQRNETATVSIHNGVVGWHGSVTSLFLPSIEAPCATSTTTQNDKC
eukprot:2562993-Amphidinium_carterae.1